MAALKLALSWIPLTRITVTSATMTMAGRSNQVPVKASLPAGGIEIERRVREDRAAA